MTNKIKYEHHLIPVIPFDDYVIESGKESYFYDNNKNKYLDLNSGQFCTVLGNSNPDIINPIKDSMDRLSHTSTSMITAEVVACSNNIYDISQKMRASCILLSTGAESVEFCLRYAKHIRKKTGIICFDKGYHGLSLGAQSVTFSGTYAYPDVKNIYPIPIPAEVDLKPSIDNLRSIMMEQEIAAILVEPIVSVGGMLFPPAAWFSRVRELCDQYEVFLILDECQTGFGRTGDWFAYQTYQFVPDMVATAKGIGLGFPVAAAMFRDTLIPKTGVYDMTHYSSHQNDSFAASVVNVGIEYITKNNVLGSVKEKGTYFLQQLKQLENKSRHIVNSRGCGLMLGADLFFDGIENYRDIYKLLHRKMLERGVIIQGTNGGRTLRFLPNYLIRREDIDYGLETLYQVLSTERFL